MRTKIITGLSIVSVIGYLATSSPVSLDVRNIYSEPVQQTVFKLAKGSEAPVGISVEEFVKHNKREDLWVVIHGKVYDLTNFASVHPGGLGVLMKYAGKDATAFFSKIHSTDIIDKMLDPSSCLGPILGELESVSADMISEQDLKLMEMIKLKPPLEHIFNVSDFEYVCKKILSNSLYTYFATGSDDEFTLRNNHYAYQRIFFKPRVLTNTKHVDLSTTFVGDKVSLPFYITAFAGQGKADDDGELNLTRVALKHNLVQMIPVMSSKTLQEITNTTQRDQNVWFQLHFENDREYQHAEDTIKKICEYDNIKLIFINADVAAESNREKDFKMRLQENSTEFDVFSKASNVYPTLSWDDFIKFKEASSKPILIKGVQRPEDIVKAAELGFRGVVISNHGGRQLDYSKLPLETLAETMQLLKNLPNYDKSKFDVYLDGGIRRGSDIIKLLSLGATGVGMGRPFGYALASYGEKGCERLVNLLHNELERDMKLLGCSDVKKLDQRFLDLSGLYNRFGNVDRQYNLLYEPMSLPKFKNED